jgi:hypothetical protein
MNSLLFKFLLMIFALVPSIILLCLLLHLYPHTGLGRIITVPSTLFVNCLLTLLGIIITSNAKKKRSVYVWLMIISLTLIVTILGYPQDYGPHVIYKIWEDIF